MIRIWTRSLTVQFIGLMLLALAASQGLGAALFLGERGEALQKASKSEFLSRCASIAQVLETTPSGVHEDILRASGTTYARFWVTAEAPGDAAAWREEAFQQLTQPLPSFTSLGSPAKFAASNAFTPPMTPPAEPNWRELPAHAWPLSRPAKFLSLNDANGMGLAVQLKDGGWLNTALAKPAPSGFWTEQSMVSIGLTAILLCAIAAFIARGITRPMRRMAAAAEALGRGEQSALPETGPDDIRRTAEAFNLMQARLQRFVDDRTRMLAAIGHDLRTPITSLRLRAEFVQDDDTREKMLATIDELRAMTEAGLAFAREESVVEETRAVDLRSLVESLCDDLAELGQDVSFEDSARVTLRCRPDALRRAVRNLVENAVRYGGEARVRVASVGKSVEIVVEDRGPGIPQEAMEQVFAPFFRLEESRSRETGGMGLGLAIARTIARRHGGDVALANIAAGLRATIVLPAPETPSSTRRDRPRLRTPAVSVQST
ncbi:sensor histidine kinase [Methylopila sp. Yamaguchi]|uniref:sensor histidine kinase n=1 Tax=Methylopila sp. Yamaguchi TaxID=1437817 RepID=UPI000CC1A85E|nr:HAMP domain-containing sensor histidine kinase [Methylopila sp. Yamaguchi]GBD47891.1 signal transduction histidine kinase [Methylopila sp. Yamaguchi]